HLGTPRMNIRGTGTDGGSLASVTRHDYLPFGEDLIAGIRVNGGSGQHGYEPPPDGVRQKFGSKERDTETGLDYFGARYYASIQGRFTSTDPIALSSDRLLDPQGINLYSYAKNNPLNIIDPNGEDYTETIQENFSFTIERRAKSKSGELIKQIRVNVKVTTTKTFNDLGTVIDIKSKATATAVNTDIANLPLSQQQLETVENVTEKIVEQAAIQGVSRAEVLGVGAKETFLGADDRRGATDFQQPAVNPLQLSSSSGRVPTTDLEANVRSAVGLYHLVGLRGYGPGANNPGGATYISDATEYINQIKAGINGSIRTSAPHRESIYYLNQQKYMVSPHRSGKPYGRLGAWKW
ncbi:MAG: RHS repeat-associated core domain-containing protein, partial [Oligoflexales bacterium]